MSAAWLVLGLMAAPGSTCCPEPQALEPVSVAQTQVQALEGTAREVARYWARGEMGHLGRLISSDGVVLHLDRGGGNTPLPARRALAALRDFLRGYETARVRVSRAVETGGSPPQGFAELEWSAVPAGTSESVRMGVFVGFVEESEGWRVSEIRVLR